MKKTFIAVLFLLSAIYALADNYRDQVKKLVTYDTAALNSMIESLKVYASQNVNNVILTDKFSEYISTQLADDIVDITMQCYRDNMTEERLSELIVHYERERSMIDTANVHVSVATSQMVYDVGYMIGNAMVAFKKGKEPEIPVAVECPEEYKHKLEDYLGHSYEELRKSFEAQLKSNKKIAGKPLSDLIPFLVKGTKIVSLNAYVKNVTEADLDVIARLKQVEDSCGRAKVADCINSTHPKLLDEIKAHFEAWAKAQ